MSVFTINNKPGDLDTIRKVLRRFPEAVDFSKGIFLKPNIVYPVKPATGEITRPGLVQALIGALREIDPDVDIVIGEGTAAGTDPLENFRVSGFADMAHRCDVELINLDHAERISVPWAFGKLQIPKIAMERTCINLPILKISSAATFSGALKNQKGLLTPEMKKKFHRMGLHRPIGEFAKVVQPDLTIMDGSCFFETPTLMAGDSAYELDRYICRTMDIPEPGYMKVAMELGVGSDSFTAYADGEIKPVSAGWEAEEFQNFLNLRLWSNPRACSMCRLMFHELKNYSAKETPVLFMSYAKLLKNGILGADILFGSDPTFNKRGKKVVCVGDCTRTLAEKEGYTHVSGCPPTTRKIFRAL